MTCIHVKCWIVFAFIFLVGPSNSLTALDAFASQRRAHPTPANIPDVSDPAYTLAPPGGYSIMGTDYLSTLAIEDSVSIGVSEGDWHEMFGDIVDVAVDHAGRLYVLDREFSEVRVFHPDGSLIDSFGRPGKGPGEFRKPMSITVSDSGSRVIVIENRAHVYRISNNGSVDFLKTFSVEGNVGCAMNGHLFTLSYRLGQVGSIQKYTLEGEWVMSFGRVYQSNSRVVQISMTRRARLACSETSDVVVLVPEKVPAIWGYSGQGDLLWTVKLEGMNLGTVEEVRGGRAIRYDSRHIGDSGLGRLFVDPQDLFNVVYLTHTGAQTLWHLFQINAQTGLGRYAGHAPLLAAAHDEYVVQHWSAPFPVLRVLRHGAQGFRP